MSFYQRPQIQHKGNVQHKAVVTTRDKDMELLPSTTLLFRLL